MLSAIILIPILAAVGVSLLSKQAQGQHFKAIALGAIALTLGLSSLLALQFDIGNPALQFEEFLPWLDDLGLTYRLGVDGLSLPLVCINGLLSLVALYSSRAEIRRPRLYFSLVLLINAAVSGAFLAQNLLLFFIFYELELIPLYLLIAIWGGVRRGYAATKFLIYTAFSGVLILGAFLGLTWLSHASSFDYQPGLAQGLSLVQQTVLLIALLIGFGIKVPLFPLHTWLPDAHVEASTPVSILLAGVLLKLGTYGLVRFCLGLFPETWALLAPWLAIWAVISVLYGSLAAIAQTDMKKMVAYSSIGHMGYILLACAAATPLSVLGAIFQMLSHGLISALLFLLVGLVYEKTGTRDLQVLRGLLNPERGLPLVGSLMILGVMASAGIPGMVGFISEFLVFRGSFSSFSIQTLLCMVGSGLTAVYFLLLVNRAFFGRLSTASPSFVPEPDRWLPAVSWGDRATAIALSGLIAVLGLSPSWVIRWSESTSYSLSQPILSVTGNGTTQTALLAAPYLATPNLRSAPLSPPES
ncbi:MAG: NADH-quinone oxidoreductase subunit M [Cyanobacteria bacterium P01_H01_bin.119]